MKKTSKRSGAALRAGARSGTIDSVAPGVANHAKVEFTLKAVKRALDSGGVGFLVLKGPQLSGLYDDPYSRTMSDLDVLVAEEDFGKAETLLLGAGFARRLSAPSRAVSGRRYNTALFALGRGFWLELHRDVAPHGRYDADLKGMFERAISFRFGGVEVKGLAEGDLLLYLCIHIAKDYFAGVEKKHFKDVALLIGKRAIDWDGFIRNAVKAGVASASYYVLLAASRQFGAAVPERVFKALRPSFFRRLWLDRHLDPGAFPVYRFPGHSDLRVQLYMALPLMDGLLKGQLAFLRYAVLRAGDIAAGMNPTTGSGGND